MTGPRQSWTRTPLRDLGLWYGGGTPSKARADFWEGGTIPWLSPKDMGSEVVGSTRDRITEAAVAGSAVRVVPANSVAIVVRSGILERKIPISLVPFETTLNQDMKAVVPRDGIDARWIAWGLREAEQDLLAHCRKAGTTVASLDAKRLQDWELSVPPIEEQRRIVDILEDHLSRLDAARNYLTGAVQRVEALQAAWLATRLGNPGKGELLSIGDVLAASRGGWSRGKRHEMSQSSGVPYLKMNNITRAGSLLLDPLAYVSGSPDEIERFSLRAGDVLFNSKNSGDLVGKTAVATEQVAGWTFNENIMRLRFDSSLIPEYVGVWFQGSMMRSHIRQSVSASTNVAAVYMHHLRAMPIWVPSRDEQCSIVCGFSDLVADRHRISGQIDVAKLRTLSLRRAVLRDALSGRLSRSSFGSDSMRELAGV
jgi:type I restriction enzyme, S subunit